jgi:hypothetical protein
VGLLIHTRLAAIQHTKNIGGWLVCGDNYADV